MRNKHADKVIKGDATQASNWVKARACSEARRDTTGRSGLTALVGARCDVGELGSVGVEGRVNEAYGGKASRQPLCVYQCDCGNNNNIEE